ncbi:MAG TPA: sugar phosphate isomerase/epimerase [Clostridiaceae bacterium]|nr:sugar phosphate isomerase/epimerase [Clostridiaceae bacterium]
MSKILYGISTASQFVEGAPIPICGDVLSNLRKAQKLGYNGIEVHMLETEPLDIDQILEVCNEENLKIASLVTGKLYNQLGIGIADPDESKASMVMRRLKRYVDLASLLNTDIVLGWIRGRIEQYPSKELYYLALGNKIKELDNYAGKKNVRILIEGINRYETKALNCGHEILEFIEKNTLENSYVHLDTFHMNIEEADMLETIRNCKDKLGYIHFADNTRHYPGAGALDFKLIIKTLHDIRYEGFVSVECLPLPDGITAAQEAIRTIKSL